MGDGVTEVMELEMGVTEVGTETECPLTTVITWGARPVRPGVGASVWCQLEWCWPLSLTF
jgi:hypothetical protein